MRLPNLPSSLFHSGILADSVNDAESTRKVYLLAGGLALLGIVLIAVTVWFWKNTRHDPALLGPLEAMGARKFHKLDDRGQQQLLDAVRPPDAQPMRWGVAHGEAPVEEIDLRVPKTSVPARYDDLRDDGAAVLPAAAADAEPDVVPVGEPVMAPSDVDADAGAVDTEVATDPRAVPVDTAADPDAVVAATSASSERVDATSETVRDEFAILDDLVAPAAAPSPTVIDDTDASAPASATAAMTDGDGATASSVVSDDVPQRSPKVKDPTPAAIPLLIVPMDHDLPPSTPAQRSPASALPRRPEPDVVPPEAVAAPKPSIDPLLRSSDHADD